MNRYRATPKTETVLRVAASGMMVSVDLSPQQPWRARLSNGFYWLTRKPGFRISMTPIEAHRLFDIREEDA